MGLPMIAECSDVCRNLDGAHVWQAAIRGILITPDCDRLGILGFLEFSMATAVALLRSSQCSFIGIP